MKPSRPRTLLSLWAALMLASTACLASSEASSDVRYRQLTRAVDAGQGRELTRDQDADWDAMEAEGWIAGIYATLTFNGSIAGQMAICPKEGVAVSTMASIYIKSMDSDPKTHSAPDYAVAIISAMKAYPCPRPVAK